MIIIIVIIIIVVTVIILIIIAFLTDISPHTYSRMSMRRNIQCLLRKLHLAFSHPFISHTHPLSHTLSHSYSVSLSHSQALALTNSISLAHTHTHTQTHIHNRTLQILRYERGQKYVRHHDADEDDVQLACGPRVLTFFLYLSDVEEGRACYSLLLISTDSNRFRYDICELQFKISIPTLSLSLSLSLSVSLHLSLCVSCPSLRLHLSLLSKSPIFHANTLHTFSGGETHFPFLNLTVTPKRGRALLWPSTYDHDHEQVTMTRTCASNPNRKYQKIQFKIK